MSQIYPTFAKDTVSDKQEYALGPKSGFQRALGSPVSQIHKKPLLFYAKFLSESVTTQI